MKTRHYIMTLYLLLLAVVSTKAQIKNSISVQNVTIRPESELTMPVNIENTTDIVAAQFTLTLPQELSIAENSTKLTSRANGHTIAMKQIADKKYMFMVYSAENKAIQLRKGALLTFCLQADKCNEGDVFDIILSDVVLSNAKGDNVATNINSGKVTIAKSPDLEVSQVTTTSSKIHPSQTINISWQVTNVGGVPTTGGWNERIFLVDTSTSLQKLIGKTEYYEILAASASVSRNIEIKLPAELGVGDKAKLQVELSPRSDTGEPSWLADNNTATTDNIINVEKTLYLSPSLIRTEEANNNNIRLYLSRSGSTTNAETFNLTSVSDSRLTLPKNITIPQGQSGVYFYGKIKANHQLDNDSTVTYSISGNDYGSIEGRIIIEDDTQPAINIATKQVEVKEGDDIVLNIEVERPSNSDINVQLACDLPTRFQIPSDIIIPKGKQNVEVTINAIDDDTPDAEKVVTFTAVAEGYKQGSLLTTLVDNDIPSLQLSLTPNAVSEGAGPLAISAKLKRTSNIDKTVTIKLSDDSNGGINYARQTIEMAAGIEELEVNLGPVDNAVVDGERIVNITASVFIASCSCNASVGTSGGVVTTPLTIYDNDGPTLTMSATSETLKEGSEMTIHITRNTNVKEALTVKLSSNQDNCIEYPSTVTFPVGSTAVDVTIKSLSNDVTIDDVIVTLTAESEGYAKGCYWFSISDQTLPDAQIKEISCADNKAEAGKESTINLTLTNIGFASLPELTVITYYLSNSSQPIAKAYLEKQLEPGASTEIKRTITMPQAVGTYNLFAVVNEDKAAKELLYTNNTSKSISINVASPYGYRLSTEKNKYNQEEDIVISGQVSGIDNSEKEIELYVINEGYRHVMTIKTDDKGKFNASYRPYSGQSGHFVVGACYPGEDSREELASFDVYGMKRADSKAITCEMSLGVKYVGNFDIINPGTLDLSGLKAQIASSPKGCEVKLSSPNTLKAGNAITISFEITPQETSQGDDWEKIELNISSAEGANLPVTLYYYCRLATGKIKSSVASINTTMTKGKLRDYPITLYNEGNGETGTIRLSLPNWITTATPQEISSLGKNESTEVILRLSPTSNMQLNVPVSGEIGINCDNGEGLSLPFYIEPVSEETGTLTIDACDENTYYTKEAPHLAGATVTIKHPTTGEVLAKGETDENGIYSISLAEGYYAVTVTADKHNTYNNNLLVDPGKDNKTVVNLSYEAIKITYDVVETEVEDQYEVKTNITYETSVPIPEVILSVPSQITAKELHEGESLVFYASLNNKGLIAAEDAEILLPSNLKHLQFELLDHTKPFKLAAQESVLIPIKVTRMSDALNAKSTRDSNIDDDPCASEVGTLYFWDCGNDRKWHRYDVALQLGSCNSNDSKTWNNTGNGIYGIGSGIGGGVGRGAGPGFGPTSNNRKSDYISSNNQSPLTTTEDKGCEPCQNGVMIAGLKCAGHFVGDAVETLKALLDLKDFNDNDDDGEIDENDKDYGRIDNKDLYDACSNYSELLLQIAQEFDGCVNGKDKIDQVLACYNGVSKTIDAIFDDLVSTAFGPYFNVKKVNKFRALGKKILKWKNVIDKIADCAYDLHHACDHLKDKEEDSKAKSVTNSASSLTSKALEGMGVYYNYAKAFSQLNNVYFGFEDAWNEMSLEEMAALFNLDYSNITYEEALKYKPEDLPNSLFEKFFKKHVEWSHNDFSNISEEDQESVMSSKKAINETFKYFKDEGYESPVDFLNTTFKQAIENANQSSSAVCSSISLQFSQQLAMTRQAFRGTLTVSNGNETKSMSNVKLQLTIKDEQGNLAMSDKFQVNLENLEGFTGKMSLTDGWGLDAKKTGVATILFIPSKNAAPTVQQRYSFSGIISYIDPASGLEVKRELSPVTLTVNPSPSLNLTYFMQRNILGDDPLTEEIEPSEEAEFSILINNVGYGDATNVRMLTQKPNIIDNEKGLAIQFNLLSSQLNSQEKSLALGGSVATDFGDIPAKATAYAQWWMTSSLLGHYTSYDVKTTHLSSYGNANLSLLNEVTIHELIRSIDVVNGDKTLKGFLTNDIVDGEDTPDMLYLSNGDVEEVSVGKGKLTKISSTQYELEVTPSTLGWCYGNVSDATYGISSLKQVTIKNEDKEISPRNIWQTSCTLRDGKDPLYENKLHFVDYFDSTMPRTYILTFEPTPELVLEVASIEGTPNDGEIAELPITQLKVMFNKPIDKSTFTSEDIYLSIQGKQQDTQQVTFATDDNKTFTLDLSKVTANAENGYYNLGIQTKHITDVEGYSGKNGKSVSWTYYKDGLVKLLTTSQPVDGGNINKVGARGTYNEVVEYGSPFSIEAKANTGYTFTSWTLDGKVISTEAVLKDVALCDYNFTANFTKSPCQLFIEAATEGGKIEGANTGIYQHGAEIKLTAVASANYEFESWIVNGVEEKSTNVLQLTINEAITISAKFKRVIFRQKLDLQEGWNWVSSYLNEPLPAVDFMEYSATIISQDKEASILLPTASYKVNSLSKFSLYSKGHLYDAKANTIHLGKGWTWIGYPYTEKALVSDAIANASEGDVIVGQFGFAEFGPSLWEGTLSYLEPNQGYLYKSSDEKELSYDLTPVAPSETPSSSATIDGSLNVRQYPSVMSIIAMVKKNGNLLASDQLRVVALNGDEVRSTSKIVNGKYYISVYGEVSDEIQFAIDDDETGERLLISDKVAFSEDILGSRAMPYVLDYDQATNIASIFADDMEVKVYNLQGILISDKANRKLIEKLPKGIYIVNGKKLTVK